MAGTSSLDQILNGLEGINPQIMAQKIGYGQEQLQPGSSRSSGVLETASRPESAASSGTYTEQMNRRVSQLSGFIDDSSADYGEQVFPNEMYDACDTPLLGEPEPATVPVILDSEAKVKHGIRHMFSKIKGIKGEQLEELLGQFSKIYRRSFERCLLVPQVAGMNEARRCVLLRADLTARLRQWQTWFLDKGIDRVFGRSFKDPNARNKARLEEPEYQGLQEIKARLLEIEKEKMAAAEHERQQMDEQRRNITYLSAAEEQKAREEELKRASRNERVNEKRKKKDLEELEKNSYNDADGTAANNVEILSKYKAKCHSCNYRFTEMKFVNLHEKYFHKKLFYCHYCARTFAAHGPLRVHCEATHLGLPVDPPGRKPPKSLDNSDDKSTSNEGSEGQQDQATAEHDGSTDQLLERNTEEDVQEQTDSSVDSLSTASASGECKAFLGNAGQEIILQNQSYVLQPGKIPISTLGLQLGVVEGLIAQPSASNFTVVNTAQPNILVTANQTFSASSSGIGVGGSISTAAYNLQHTKSAFNEYELSKVCYPSVGTGLSPSTAISQPANIGLAQPQGTRRRRRPANRTKPTPSPYIAKVAGPSRAKIAEPAGIPDAYSNYPLPPPAENCQISVPAGPVSPYSVHQPVENGRLSAPVLQQSFAYSPYNGRSSAPLVHETIPYPLHPASVDGSLVSSQAQQSLPFPSYQVTENDRLPASLPHQNTDYSVFQLAGSSQPSAPGFYGGASYPIYHVENVRSSPVIEETASYSIYQAAENDQSSTSVVQEGPHPVYQAAEDEQPGLAVQGGSSYSVYPIRENCNSLACAAEENISYSAFQAVGNNRQVSDFAVEETPCPVYMQVKNSDVAPGLMKQGFGNAADVTITDHQGSEAANYKEPTAASNSNEATIEMANGSVGNEQTGHRPGEEEFTESDYQLYESMAQASLLLNGEDFKNIPFRRCASLPPYSVAPHPGIRTRAKSVCSADSWEGKLYYLTEHLFPGDQELAPNLDEMLDWLSSERPSEFFNMFNESATSRNPFGEALADGIEKGTVNNWSEPNVVESTSIDNGAGAGCSSSSLPERHELIENFGSRNEEGLVKHHVRPKGQQTGKPMGLLKALLKEHKSAAKKASKRGRPKSERVTRKAKPLLGEKFIPVLETIVDAPRLFLVKNADGNEEIYVANTEEWDSARIKQFDFNQVTYRFLPEKRTPDEHRCFEGEAVAAESGSEISVERHLKKARRQSVASFGEGSSIGMASSGSSATTGLEEEEETSSEDGRDVPSTSRSDGPLKRGRGRPRKCRSKDAVKNGKLQMPRKGRRSRKTVA